eukprot:scaffold36269_cov124-Isochrysis_galbana.AAC.4
MGPAISAIFKRSGWRLCVDSARVIFGPHSQETTTLIPMIDVVLETLRGTDYSDSQATQGRDGPLDGQHQPKRAAAMQPGFMRPRRRSAWIGHYNLRD